MTKADIRPITPTLPFQLLLSLPVLIALTLPQLVQFDRPRLFATG